jgi:hypothetical protein
VKEKKSCQKGEKSSRGKRGGRGPVGNGIGKFRWDRVQSPKKGGRGETEETGRGEGGG